MRLDEKGANDPVVQMCPMQGDGQHVLVVLTSHGKMYQRVADPRAFNSDGRGTRQYMWQEIKGPDAEA